MEGNDAKGKEKGKGKGREKGTNGGKADGEEGTGAGGGESKTAPLPQEDDPVNAVLPAVRSVLSLIVTHYRTQLGLSPTTPASASTSASVGSAGGGSLHCFALLCFALLCFALRFFPSLLSAACPCSHRRELELIRCRRRC